MHRLRVQITNDYETGASFRNYENVEIPEGLTPEQLDDWMFSLTGEGPEYGHLNAWYTVEILEGPEDLVGKFFEWEG